VAEVEQVAGGEVGAEPVVADRGETRAVGAQRQHVRQGVAGLPERCRGVDARGGEDQAVDPASHQ
jgi:hypothetical protein